MRAYAENMQCSITNCYTKSTKIRLKNGARSSMIAATFTRQRFRSQATTRGQVFAMRGTARMGNVFAGSGAHSFLHPRAAFA